MSQCKWALVASRSPVLSGVLNGIGTLAQRRQPGGEEARAASNGAGWWEVGVLHCGTIGTTVKHVGCHRMGWGDQGSAGGMGQARERESAE